MNLIQNYNDALAAIYEHVGFKPDWVVYPISDETEHYWTCDGETVEYAESADQIGDETGNYYYAEVYTQRFYNKWVYEGETYTMIFMNPGVDGMKYFGIFDNAKRIK